MMPGTNRIRSIGLTAAAILASALVSGPSQAMTDQAPEPLVQSRTGALLTIDGDKFRDLDHYGHLTPYEDWRLSPAARANDLVTRMTLEEKAGTMMHSTLPGVGSIIGHSPEGYDFPNVAREIERLAINSFITRLPVPQATVFR